MKPLERRWVWLFAAGAIVLTGLPYVWAAMQPGVEFTGFLFGVEDGNSYIAKMLRGAQGDWLFRSPFAPIQQAGALVYLPYLLLGKLIGSAAPHSVFVVGFHVIRSASIAALCFASYEFISMFLSDVKFRKAGLVLITFGAGLGWILLLFGIERLFGAIPLDFYSPETFGFLAVFGIPHLVLARALLLWGFARHLRGEASAWSTALLWFALAACHVVTAVLGVGLLLLHLAYLTIRQDLRRRAYARSLLWAGFGTLPILVSNVWSLLADPYIANWATQNQILSPHPVHYLLAYGWLVPLAAIGLRELQAGQRMAFSLLLVWVTALPLLIYAPVGLQRRLAEGAWVMLIVLVLYALQSRVKWRVALLLLFVLALPSTILLFAGAWQTASNLAMPAFRTQTEVAAFEQLRTHVDEGDLVLSSYSVGNALPAWVPASVLIGHGPEGMNEAELTGRITEFFASETKDENRVRLLNQYSVDFVFWGPEERKLGLWDPTEADYLVPVISVEDVQVFRVAND